MFTYKTKDRGFTLIELLVVIAIIGILSSVVLASLNSARTKSRDAKRVSDIKQLQLALELYFDSNNGYPSAISPANLVTTVRYIATIPTDPTTGAVYSYAALASNCTDYHLGAQLEDSNHTVLNSDIDDAVVIVTNQCPDEGSPTAKTDFNGGGGQPNGDDPDAPIFDVKP